MSVKTLVARALGRRCPRCGERDIWTSWFNTRESCPRCGLLFAREEGYWVMAIVLNTAFVEAIFALLFVGGLITTWPDIDWQFLLAAGLLTNGILPFLFFPYSKTLWVALDLYTHRASKG